MAKEITLLKNANFYFMKHKSKYLLKEKKIV